MNHWEKSWLLVFILMLAPDWPTRIVMFISGIGFLVAGDQHE